MMTDRLFIEASAARANAYAPYSGYKVGAALLDEQGRIWSGCNVENVSYGLTLCAERNAVSALVSHGGLQVVEMLVLTNDAAPPCGACLQVLREFAPKPENLSIHLADENGVRDTVTLLQLFPRGFSSNEVKSNAR
jgi:cytidine deaminase